MPAKTTSAKNEIEILLLEGVHPRGIGRLREEGFAIQAHKRAFAEEELEAAIEGIDVLGIRSKTRVTKRAIERSRRLVTIGAFCIGTNQIDLDAARSRGIPVFNAPYSSTRSVAELVIADIIILFRGLYDKIHGAHEGNWTKSSSGSVEVRGKTVGIVGYGHIGRQVSVLAESFGMRVLYCDIVDKLSMGNATRVTELRDLLERSDVVTLHVPGTKETEGLIGAREIGWMKKGAYLVNTSRGSVVDLEALRDALVSGKLAGAAVDVFPKEPKQKGGAFETPLQNLPNVVLTPHIGGSTQEAQRNIGLEVAGKVARYINNGSTEGAVNFPNVVLPELAGCHRILHIHRNVPGVLQKVNAMFGEVGINVAAQHLRTYEDIGYLIMDTEKATRKIVRQLATMEETIKTRILS